MIMPFMVLVVMWVVILLLAFPSLYGILLFAGQLLIIITVCYCVGYGLSYCITRIIDKVDDRRSKRFYWYRRMGLFESARLVEPKFAKNYD